MLNVSAMLDAHEKLHKNSQLTASKPIVELENATVIARSVASQKLMIGYGLEPISCCALTSLTAVVCSCDLRCFLLISGDLLTKAGARGTTGANFPVDLGKSSQTVALQAACARTECDEEQPG